MEETENVESPIRNHCPKAKQLLPSRYVSFELGGDG